MGWGGGGWGGGGGGKQKGFVFLIWKKQNKLRLSNSAHSRSLFLHFCLMLHWLYKSAHHCSSSSGTLIWFICYSSSDNPSSRKCYSGILHTRSMCVWACVHACMCLLHTLAHTLTHRCNDTQTAEHTQWRKVGILKLRTVSLGATQTWWGAYWNNAHLGGYTGW